MRTMKEKRNLILSFFYLLCLYLAVQLLPLQDWISLVWLRILVKGLLDSVILFLALYETYRAKPFTCKREMNPWLFLPFIFVAGSNFIYAFLYLKPSVQFESSVFFTSLIDLTLCVILEELLFRNLLLEFFIQLFTDKKLKDELSILCSAISFSLMHAINFFGNPVGSVFSQLGYTFFLGLAFGYMALFSENHFLPSIAHFIFNFLNTLLFTTLYSLEEYTWMYFVLSISIGLAFVLYLVLVYVLSHRKKESDHVS